MQLSLLAAVVMLLPVEPMEGFDIWGWKEGLRSKAVWALFFFPVLFFSWYSLLLQYMFLSSIRFF